MNRYPLILAAAALIVFAAASHAADSSAPDVAAPAAASDSPSDATSPSAPPSSAPEPKTEAQPAPAAPAPAPAAPAPAVVAPAPATVAPVPAPIAPKAEAKAQPKSDDKSEQASAAPAAKPAEKPLNTCAAKLEPVVDAYQQAHDSLLAWLRTASGKMDAADAKVADLKKSIAENEGKITQLKLDSSAKNETQMRDLDKATRDLWSQLKAEDAHRKELCRALASVAGQKVRDLNRAVLEQLEKSSQAQ